MRKLLYLFGFLIFFSSCGWLNPSIMLKTDKNYAYDTIVDSTQTKNYKISANDLLEFRIFSNDGFKLIDLTSLNQVNRDYQMNTESQYLVEQDGNVKLPILGLTKLSGYTIREAEVMLQEKYADFYVKPFILIEVSNKRVIVFPGQAGTARVIPLLNNNTTLIEALALAGGISEDGKAKKVKLIRTIDDKSSIYMIDLSTITGIKDANMVLQANDIIYVEPRRKYTNKLVQEIAPIISLLSSAFIIIAFSITASK